MKIPFSNHAKTRESRNKKRTKKTRIGICMSLSCRTMEDIRKDVEQYLEYVDYVEWCVSNMDGSDTWSDSEYLSLLDEVKALVKPKKLIVNCKAADARGNHLIRLSMGKADIIDISFGNPDIGSLVRQAKRKKVKTLISYHDYEKMPSKNEIAEQYLRMEKSDGDIIKIACIAKDESDMFAILEGASMYKSLKNTKPIVAIAMGEAGQPSRICAGDFGSVISYGCGTEKTAPGQLNVAELKAYIDRYYAERSE